MVTDNDYVTLAYACGVIIIIILYYYYACITQPIAYQFIKVTTLTHIELKLN